MICISYLEFFNHIKVSFDLSLSLPYDLQNVFKQAALGHLGVDGVKICLRQDLIFFSDASGKVHRIFE
jgi:hypothetical protein